MRCAGTTLSRSRDSPAGHRHLYTLFLSSDGNFKLQRKKKVDDRDDIALNEGNAYFPKDDEYQDYVSKIGLADDVCLRPFSFGR